MKLNDLVLTSKLVADTSGRLEKIALLAALLKRLAPNEVPIAIGFLTGWPRQGKLGVGWASVAEARPSVSAATPTLDLVEVDQTFTQLQSARGKRSGAERQRMLSDAAPTVKEALVSLGTAVIEWKLDGARVQVHREGDRVAVYTRSLNDVTPAVPEVVEAVLALPVHEIILDGEVIALKDGRPLAFQDTMRRFGKRLNVDALRATLPLTPFFFDVLRLDGEDLLDCPLFERLARLDAVVPAALRVPSLTTADVAEAQRFEADAIARGHEGLMAKLPSAPYAAGRRGSAWIKVKTARTLDLVVLAVEWGSGRRQGWLSNIHLGARDPATGGFVMLGKTFKGMTDEMLDWQTKEFLAREVRRDGHILFVRPELVVEVAFNEVQRSSQYPGGVTLRFARIKGYRPDKRASDADTIDAVRAFAP